MNNLTFIITIIAMILNYTNVQPAFAGAEINDDFQKLLQCNEWEFTINNHNETTKEDWLNTLDLISDINVKFVGTSRIYGHDLSRGVFLNIAPRYLEEPFKKDAAAVKGSILQRILTISDVEDLRCVIKFR